MTVAQYAALYGKSIRTIKRWKAKGLPLDNEQAMRQIIALKRSRLGVSRLSPKSPVTVVKPEPKYEYDSKVHDLVRVHFGLVKLAWDDADLRARLKPIFSITRRYVEED